jgi:oligopeptide transport system substrate-binding protein
MKKAFIAIFTFILISLMGLLLIQKPQKPQKKNRLRISLPASIQGLHRTHDAMSCTIHKMLFEGLMRKDASDTPQLAIASKIDISEDKKKYVFHLRDCKWSDGVEVTAYDFEYSWKNAIDPNSKSITLKPDLFYPIKQAELCLSGKVPIKDVSIYAIDDKTLSVELEYPAPYFLEITANPFLFPVPKHIAEKDPDWAIKPTPVCNGPFIIKQRTPDSKFTLMKNPHYWDQKHVYLDGIDIFIIPHMVTAVNMFQKGELDWIGSPFGRISFDISFDVLNEETEDALIYWFSINTEKYPLNNKKLRKALSYAVDRKSIVDNVFHYTGKPTMSVLPILMRLRNEPYFEDNNQVLAQKLLQEALEELGLSRETLPEIELSYFDGFEFAKRVCMAVQDQWRKVLNLKNIRLKATEYQVYFSEVTKGNYDIGFMGWNTPIFDPLFILNAFRNKSHPVNVTNWEKEEFRALLNQSNYVLENSKRTNILIQAETLLMDEMPIIPLYSLNKRFAKNNNLKGEFLSRLQTIDFKSAYFEKTIQE